MIRFTEKKWVLHNANERCAKLSLSLRERVLAQRGIDSAEDIGKFLDPPLETGWDPFLLSDMKEACDIILDSIRDKKSILVYGDYDADGICATASLVLFLRSIGCNPLFVIPDRMLEGYGLGELAAEKILRTGASLVITVDCGVSSISEVKNLMEHDIQVIVTDHHECKESLPQACAVINPKRKNDQYPFKDLAGSAVVLKLIQGLCFCRHTPDIWAEYLDLVMLGTMGDMVSLTGENRMIVKQGLSLLNRRERAGLNVLADYLGYPVGGMVSSRDVSFSFVPHINAAGRVGDGTRAAELLMSDRSDEQRKLAGELIADNQKRRQIEREIFTRAVEQLRETFDPSVYQIMIAWDKSFHQGVSGIVASRLTNYFNRPAIVFAWDGYLYRGSARSFGRHSILEDIAAVAEHTVQFGGHLRAAGVSVEPEALDSFIQAINRHVAVRNAEELYTDEMHIAMEVDVADLTMQNANELSHMEPFGEGNPCPLFLCRNLAIQRTAELSDGKHMKLFLTNAADQPQAQMVEAIAFGFSNRYYALHPGERVDVVFSLERNEFNGNTCVQLLVKDLRKVLSDKNSRGDGMDSALLLRDSEIAAVYKKIRRLFGYEQVLCDATRLLAIFAGNDSDPETNNMTPFKIARIFDIFNELGLIFYRDFGKSRMLFRLSETDKKVLMTDSPTYRRIRTESVD